MTQLSILYSFRRCPYAMRARMALVSSDVECELREVVLRDKPQDMLTASPKGTVPVMLLPDGKILEESFDIMIWALQRHDPRDLLNPQTGTRVEMETLITDMDGDFKSHLDKYKYASRHNDDQPGLSPEQHRDAAMSILMGLNKMLEKSPYLFGDNLALADIAIAPFVRQFCNVDADWFNKQPAPHLQKWLAKILASDLFIAITLKYPRWTGEDAPVYLCPLSA